VVDDGGVGLRSDLSGDGGDGEIYTASLLPL